MKQNELILVGAVVLLTLPVALVSDNWAGVFLVYLSIALVFTPAEFRHDWRILGASIFVLLLRHAVSVTNAYYTTVYGADEDAAGFHLTAQQIANSPQPEWFAEFGNFEVGARFYAHFLAFFYRVFGDSLLVGQGLSVIAYVISSILLVKLAGLFDLPKWKTYLVLLYGLLPPSLLFGSVTMRESYQMLFFLAAVYWAVKFKRSPSLLSLAILIISSACLGLLHNGLILYALFFVCFSVLWGLGIGFKNLTKQRFTLQILALFLVAGIFTAWGLMATNLSVASRAIVAGEGVSYMGGYRERADYEARASYEVSLNVSSPVSFAYSSVLVFIYYLFAPFPWQVRNMLDVYAVFESLMRLLLIFYGLAAWRRSTGARRSQYGYLLIAFFSLEFLWALGTANWGTAIRHHLVAYGLLVIAGGPGLLLSLLRMFRRNDKVARPVLAGAGGGTRLMPRYQLREGKRL